MRPALTDALCGKDEKPSRFGGRSMLAQCFLDNNDDRKDVGIILAFDIVNV